MAPPETTQAKKRKRSLTPPPKASTKRQDQPSSRPTRSAAVTAKLRLSGSEPPLDPINLFRSPVVQQKPRPPHADKIGKAKGGGKSSRKSRAVSTFESWVVDGEEYKAGDNVYVVFDNAAVDSDEDECCEVCGSAHTRNPMLECSRCLRGFHIRCLKPPMKAVPPGDWLCPACDQGVERPAPSKLQATWQKFLYTDNSFGLCRIEGFIKNRTGDGSVEFSARWYVKPEETHQGRQKHHDARELFLSNRGHYESVACLWKKTQVVKREDMASSDGNDVFCCEYEYDETWKRFRRLQDEGCEEERLLGAGSDSEPSSDDEEGDHNYQPLESLLAERGLPGAAGFRRRGCAAKRKGHEAAWIGLGAAQVPEEARVAPSCPFARAKASLTLTALPNSLPCRDNEKQQLVKFVSQALSPGAPSPGVLYICGVPGTGKTVTVSEVVAGFRKEAKQQGVQVALINGLSLPSPTHAYSRLLEKLTGNRAGPARALSVLEGMFTPQTDSASARLRGMRTLVIVDEVDVLLTRDQAVLYNLFEWPLRAGSRLSVIAISNTHDLDERVLTRIASRLAGSKLAFRPYSNEQLATIIQDRLGEARLIAPAAIKYAAAKVGLETGDARRALELLRRAVEIAEAERRGKGKQGQAASSILDAPDGCVTTAHVNAAIKEMFESVHMQMLRASSKMQRLLLASIVLEARATSKADVLMSAVCSRLGMLCEVVQEPAPHTSSAIAMAARLASQHLLLSGPPTLHTKMRVGLNIHRDDLAFVVKDDASLSRLMPLL